MFLNDTRKPVLSQVNLTLSTGKKYLCLGGNGSGKSTLLKAIMGLQETKCTGAINWLNSDITHLNCVQRSKLGIFLSFQETVAIESLSLQDLCSLIASDINPNWKRELAELLLYFQLPKKYASEPLNKSNSGGEKKLNEAIQLLLLKPKLCLLDEIEAGIDNHRFSLLISKLQELQKCGSTFLVVTHNASKWSPYDDAWTIEKGLLLKT